jgi:ubiquinone/menaquinone biosynthesis C-methylase UbiE
MEIELLKKYPKAKRNLDERSASKEKDVISTARKFGKEFFDGDRKFGYGGFKYQSKYWNEVVKDIFEFYDLKDDSSILDVGCAKGFMLYDFINNYPNLKIKGIDISSYAINNSKPEVSKFLEVGNAKNLNYKDNSFDLVISINTVHNLEIDECKIAIKEIQRVSKSKSFITVDAYRNDREKENMYKWNLTAKTILSVKEWISLFKEVGYKGDYYWFIP